MTRILCLDDDPLIGDILNLVLTRGYTAVDTDDAYEAWALLHSFPFDLLTQDASRGDINGKENNKGLLDLIQDAIQAFNAHDLDGWMEFYIEDAVHIQPNLAEPLSGRAKIREDYLKSTWVPFPDFHFELERAFGENDWMCVTGVLTGTHKGPLTGLGEAAVAPTNRSIRVPICLVIQFEDRQAVRVYEYNDQLGLLSQLGLTA